jgi:hypothetical protein
MALPSALRGSWNPLRVDAAPMPPGLMLMCKLMALAFLATRHFNQFQTPFLPFVPGLDALVPGPVFQHGLQALAISAALALLFNRCVRLSAFTFGACMLLAVLSSRTYYGNNKSFVGVMMVMAALCDFERPPYLVRWQFALVYFGAALNKLLDADWRSGLFFDYWGGVRVANPVYVWLADALPPRWMGMFMGWLTILGEFAISLCALVPRLGWLAIGLNLGFQVGLVQFTGDTFNLFFYAMCAASFAFVDCSAAPSSNALSRWACGHSWYWMLAVVVLALCPTPLARRACVLAVLALWSVAAAVSSSRGHGTWKGAE